MTTTQDQPQVVSFLHPEGFIEGYVAQAKAQSRTIFVTRPTDQSQGSCLYLVDENKQRCFLPNTINLYLTELNIVTQEYDNAMYSAQDKLLMTFTTTGGDSFTTRCGATSFTASSLVLGLCHLNSVALTGELQVSFVPKGAAVFANVGSAVNGGYVSAPLPKAALGYRLTFDEIQDGLSYINQSIQGGDVIPPNFFAPHEPEETAAELTPVSSILEELRVPTKHVPRPIKNAAAVEATA